MAHYLKWVYSGKGGVEQVKCVNHTYRWSGKIPCTGVQVCIYCGKPKDEKEEEE